MKSSTHVWHVNSSAQSVEVDSLYQNTFQNTWNVLHMWTHTGEKAIQVHKVWQLAVWVLRSKLKLWNLMDEVDIETEIEDSNRGIDIETEIEEFR